MTDLTGPEVDNVTAVAKRLAQRVARERILTPADIDHAIEERFGEGWAHGEANADHDLSARVLTAFRELSPDAVWDEDDQTWRQEAAEPIHDTLKN